MGPALRSAVGGVTPSRSEMVTAEGVSESVVESSVGLACVGAVKVDQEVGGAPAGRVEADDL